MLAESPDTTQHAREPVCGNFSFACPLQQCARLDLQVLRSLVCGEPFGFHVQSPFPDASPAPFVCCTYPHVPFIGARCVLHVYCTCPSLVRPILDDVQTPSAPSQTGRGTPLDPPAKCPTCGVRRTCALPYVRPYTPSRRRREGHVPRILEGLKCTQIAVRIRHNAGHVSPTTVESQQNGNAHHSVLKIGNLLFE